MSHEDAAPQPLGTEVRAVGVPAILFGTVGAAAAWALHLGIDYTIVWAVCTFDLGGGRLMLGASTLLFAALGVASGVLAFRQLRRGTGEEAWDRILTAPLPPLAYLMLVGLLSAIVFVLLILLSALPAFFAPLCPSWPGYPQV